MNCKQGDLAIAIRTETGKNVGRIVEVVEPLMCLCRQGVFCEWVIRTPGGTLYAMPDAWLRPIFGIPDEQDVEREEHVAA